MKTIYFSVFDHKTQAYGQLFPSQTEGSAVRAFQDSINDGNSMVNKHPDDFALFKVAEFNDETGLFDTKYEPPQLVCNATALIKP